MSLTYSQFVSTIANLAAMSETDTNFLQILPSAIDYVENRTYRALDMIVENVRDSSSSTTSLDRNFNLPTSLGVFSGPLDGINIITPASTAPDSGTRVRLEPVSLDFLDFSWPSSTGADVPQYFAYISQSALAGQYNIVFGPWPDDTYRVEVIGKIQPAPLSATNTTTYLSTYMPDLMINGAMVFVSGWQQDFGRVSDSPQQSMSWEAQYLSLLKDAATWEARKRWAGPSWTSKQPEPTAVPQRG